MEALTQSLKIGAALAVLVAVAIYAVPEQPSLFAGRSAPVAAGPDASSVPAQIAPAEAETPRPEAEAPAPPAAPPVETAQAPAPAPAAAPPAEPTSGQSHLERLRAGAGRAPETPAPVAETPTPEPEAAPADDTAVIPPPAQENGPQRGLADLTQPASPPSFRLFRDVVAADAGTIFTDDQTIRIAGVEPPAAGASCAGGPCEDEARAALSGWLSGRSLLCAVDAQAGPSTTAPCVAGEDDVGQWLVSNGWATASPGSRYSAEEEEARAQGLGIWSAN